MRLFVAVDISDETRAAIAAVRTALERAVSAAPRPPRITWVREASAHVTVRFIGEVDETTARAAAAALTPGLELAPFDVEWTTLAVFPPGRAGLRSPRAIWIGATAGVEALSALATVVNHRLAPIVSEGGERSFTAHLTVGRVKLPGKGVAWADVIDGARPPPTRSRVDRVTLYQSQLSSRGPTYTAIAAAELCG
jgi:2'-5' RNA ligase